MWKLPEKVTATVEVNEHEQQSKTSHGFEQTDAQLPSGDTREARPLPGTDKRSWRPMTLRTSFFGIVIVFPILAAMFLGALQYYDSKNGALLLAKSGTDFSNVQLFLVRYLPTIVIVIYSILVTWVDMDIKRLEPWYQLSQGESRPAANHILLRYDVDFVLSVIYKAIKSRHWLIVQTSLMLILATIVVPTLQNAMFTTKSVILQRPISTQPSGGLISVQSQVENMSAAFLTTAYSVNWLGQDLPGFTTREYALTPFQYNLPNVAAENTTILGTSTKLWTELQCTEPVFINASWPDGVLRGSVTFHDGDGCEAEDILQYGESQAADEGFKYQAYYIGYDKDGFSNSHDTLTEAGCSRSGHKFLAIWAELNQFEPDFGVQGNATALFCQPSYYFQPVTATVRASDNKVFSVTSAGPQQILDETLFNRTHFETILAIGANPGTQASVVVGEKAKNRDAPELGRLLQDGRLVNMSLASPVDNMVGFAVGATHLDSASYLNATELYRSFESAHKLLFALAASSNMKQASDHPIANSAHTLFETNAIRLVPGFTYSTMVVLFVTALIALYLLIAQGRRDLQLMEDPESLAQIMLVAGSHRTQKAFERLNSVSDEVLETAIKDSCFKLENKEGSRPRLELHQNLSRATSNLPSCQTKMQGQSPPKHPFELTWTAIGSVVVSLVVGMALLVRLDGTSLIKNGLPIPTSKDIVMQLLLNVLPAVLATLLGSYLTLLCRVQCFLQPMNDLRAGNAPAAKTLMATYTSMPPQLVFWPAIKTKHFMLAMLSIASLLTNILTITLPSTIFQTAGLQSTPDAAIRLYEPFVQPFNESRQAVQLQTFQDPFHAIVPNLTNHTALPIWTSPHYAFLPLQLPSSSNPEDVRWFEATLIGYGADLDCQELLPQGSKERYSLEFQGNGSFFRLQTFHDQSDGSVINCQYEALDLSNEGFGSTAGTVDGAAALELSCKMTYAQNNTQFSFCNGLIVKGWVRASAIASGSQSQMDSNATGSLMIEHDETIMSCKPRLKQRNFLTRVSPDGRLLHLEPLSDPTYDLPSSANLSLALNEFVPLFVGAENMLATPVWHKDTIARDWLNYLAKKYLNSTQFLDATAPPPDSSEIAPVLSDIFGRLFAIEMSLLTPQLQTVEGSSSARHAADKTTPVVVIRERPCLSFSQNMYNISIAILGLNIVILVVYRLGIPRPFLPRMPFTIASQIAYFAGSRLMEDLASVGGDLELLDRQGCRYGYGKLIGGDGWVRIGIEREPFVYKLDSSTRPALFDRLRLGKNDR